MSSRRHQRRRECERKKRYPDANAAQRAAYGVARWNSQRMMFASAADMNMHAYHCPHCGGWHIGHVIGTNTTARRRKDMAKNGIR